MPRKPVVDLLAETHNSIYDNEVGGITAENLRNLLLDIIDTFAPGYGIVSVDSLTLVALGITPQVVTYDTALASTPEYVVDLALGTVQRLAQSLPSTVNRVSFYADLAAPTGDEVVFSLFRDGIDIPGGGTVSGQGLGNVVQAAFSIATTAEDSLDHTYDVRASKVTGGADNVELANVRFILESVPTLGI